MWCSRVLRHSMPGVQYKEHKNASHAVHEIHPRSMGWKSVRRVASATWMPAMTAIDALEAHEVQLRRYM